MHGSAAINVIAVVWYQLSVVVVAVLYATVFAVIVTECIR